MQVVVIGAGITGLAAAHDLVRGGLRPVLIERTGRPGGLLQTEERHGNLIECGPDSLVAQKSWALDFLREAGLADQLVGSNDAQRRTWIFRDGRLLPLPDGMQLMVPTRIGPIISSPLLGWATKFRMGLDALRWWPPADGDVAVSEFVRRHYGDEAVEYLAEPLLAGVYGGDVDRLSAECTLPALVALEQKFGGLSRGVLASRPKQDLGSVFYTLRDGMSTLGTHLWRTLESRAELHAAEAHSIRRTGDLWRVDTSAGTIEAAEVIVACPAAAAARIVAAESPALASELDSIEHSSCGTITFGYRRGSVELPSGFGLLVPRAERRHLAACTFVGTKFPHRTHPDWVLVRAFLAGDEAAAFDAVTARAVALDELQRVAGISAKPEFEQWNAWPRSMPQFTLGHAERVRRIHEAVGQMPGLRLAGNYLDGVGLADAIRWGRRAATRVLQAAATHAAPPPPTLPTTP
jgi:oxygen-dependent protoporphyrinogen oxidase